MFDYFYDVVGLEAGLLDVFFFGGGVTFSCGMSHLTAPSTALESIHIKHL